MTSLYDKDYAYWAEEMAAKFFVVNLLLRDRS